MTLVVLRPDAVISNTGTVAGSGGTAAQVLADDSDASYVIFNADQGASLGLGDLALPGGAVVKTVAVRARFAEAGTNSVLQVFARSAGFPDVGGDASPPSTSPSTISVGNFVTGWGDAAADAATLDLDVPIGTTGGGGSESVNVYEGYVDVVYVAQPITSVTAPTGTVSDTNLPTVRWTNTLDSDGGGQQFYEVKVYTDAQYLAPGFHPDTSTPTAHGGLKDDGSYDHWTQGYWTVPDILPDDTYRAYVRVAQVVNGEKRWSSWNDSTFTVSVALPAVPTITPTAQNTAGRISVDVSSSGGPATTDALELERSADGGASWVPVRNTEGDTGWISANNRVIYDYEAPNGTVTTYRARALHDYSGEWAASAWGEASTTWTADQWWVKHPHKPALNVPVEMFSYSEVTRGARRGVFQPLGASVPVVVSDTRLGETGTVTLQLHTTAVQDALDALLDTTAVLLLQGPSAHGHPDRYVSFGDHQSSRVVDKGRFHITRETLPWTLVPKPSGAQRDPQYAAPAEAGEELVLA